MVVSGELKLPNDRVKRRGSEADSVTRLFPSWFKKAVGISRDRMVVMVVRGGVVLAWGISSVALSRLSFIFIYVYLDRALYYLLWLLSTIIN
jgi:hypothetical protein